MGPDTREEPAMNDRTDRRSVLALGGAVVAAAAVGGGPGAGARAAEDERCDALFVIRAAGVSFDGTSMVLSGTDPHITWARRVAL